jgi:hypothetical protein
MLIGGEAHAADDFFGELCFRSGFDGQSTVGWKDRDKGRREDVCGFSSSDQARFLIGVSPVRRKRPGNLPGLFYC